MSEEKEVHRAGLYYIIPAEIMESTELTSTEKLLYGLLTGLSDSKGECYPSDAYLAERLGIGAREPINRMIAKFEEMGILTKQTTPHPANPFKKRRTITLQMSFKKCLRSDSQVTVDSDRPVTQELTQKSHRVSEVNRVSEEYVCNASARPHSGSEKERVLNVKTSDDEHQKLIERLGVQKTTACYQRLADWKLDTPKAKWKKNDYRSILRWVINAVEKSEQEQKDLQWKKTKSPTKSKDYKHTSSASDTPAQTFQTLGILLNMENK